MRSTVEKGFDRASDFRSSFSLQTCGSPHFVFPLLGFGCGFVGRMFSVLVSVSRRLLSRVSRFLVSFAPRFPVGSSQRNRGITDLKVQNSETGHPALAVSHFPGEPPPVFEGSPNDEIWMAACEVYMSADVAAASACVSVSGASSTITSSPSTLSSLSISKGNLLFYPKKIPLEVHNMLSDCNGLSGVSFFTWWRNAKQSNDFWIETKDEMIRVHVVPRQFPFDPSAWKTSDSSLRSALLNMLDGRRITEAVVCLGEGTLKHVHSDEMSSKFFPWAAQQWVGRSRFSKLKTGDHPTKPSTVGPHVRGMPQPKDFDAAAPVALENEQVSARGGTESPGGTFSPFLAGSRASTDGGGDPSTGEAQGGDQRSSPGSVQVLPRRVGQESHGPGDYHAGQADQGMAHEGYQRCEQHSGGHSGPVRQVQGLDVPRDTGSVSRMGHGGGGGQPQLVHGPSTSGILGKEREDQGQDSPQQDQVPCNGPRGVGQDSSALGQGHVDGPSGSDASWSQVSTTRSKGTPVRRQMSEEEEINLLQSRLEMLQARQKKRESVMIVDGDETES